MPKKKTPAKPPKLKGVPALGSPETGHPLNREPVGPPGFMGMCIGGPNVLVGNQLQQYQAQMLTYRRLIENKPVSSNLLLMAAGHTSPLDTPLIRLSGLNAYEPTPNMQPSVRTPTTIFSDVASLSSMMGRETHPAAMARENHSSPLMANNYPSPLMGPNHSSPLMVPNHSSPLMGPNHSSPLMAPNHSSPLMGTNHSSPLMGNNHPSPLMASNHPSSLIGSNHPSPLMGSNHSSPMMGNNLVQSPMIGRDCNIPATMMVGRENPCPSMIMGRENPCSSMMGLETPPKDKHLMMSPVKPPDSLMMQNKDNILLTPKTENKFEPLLNPAPSNANIHDSLVKLSQEARELYINSEVTILDEVPTPLEFYRDWVAPNKPVIIRGAMAHWPAINKWTRPYLRSQIGNKSVTVAVTPNGYADAPKDGFFVMPDERTMKFGHFLDIIDEPQNHNGIFYVQKQNSNLTEEFCEIMCDVSEEIQWFSDALGKKPDAVNFWMGDERAVTSMHKDNYENLYCVVSGYKDFILHPPTDAPWIPYKLYPSAVYSEDTDGNFNVGEDKDTGKVPWICIDPLNPDILKYPMYDYAKSISCRVHAGDAFYLPSLWYHHVRQSHGCIAVNYWYDMEYDIKYNYSKLLQNLTWNEQL